MRGRIAAALATVALAACSGGARTATTAKGGQVLTVIQASTSTAQITRVNVALNPAGTSQDLAYQPSTGTFSGVLTGVPVGTQTVTATAYAGATVVGSGSATVTVTLGGTASAFIRILDSSPPPPVPDHGPIITSVTVSKTNPMAGESISLGTTAVDVDGDAIAYTWGASCAGTFDAPSAASTGWASSVEGACTITVTATSKALSDTKAIRITVGTATGAIDVNGVFVPQPTIQRVAILDALQNPIGAVCDVGRSDADASCRAALAPNQPTTIVVTASNAAPDARYSVTSSCGGLVTPTRDPARFTWKTPGASGTVCVITASVSQATLSDAFPVAAPLAGCLDDNYEHNNSPAQATVLRDSPYGAMQRMLRANDDDWYLFKAATSNISVTLTTAASLGVELVAADQSTVLGTGVNGITFNGTPGATYYLHVKPDPAYAGTCSPTYDVTIRTAALAGTFVNTFVSLSGDRVVPLDLSPGSGAIIEAWDSAGGPVTGTGDAFGNFWFESLAPGPVTLHVQVGAISGPYNRWYVTANPFVKLGGARAGHDDVWMTQPTPLTVAIDGLRPWAATDALQLVDSTGRYLDLGAVSSGAPVDGATSAATTFDLNGYGSFPLLTTADEAWVLQTEQLTAADGTAYGSVLQAGKLPPLAIADGVAATTSVTLSGPVPRFDYQPTLDPSAFTLDPASFSPRNSFREMSFFVDALPGFEKWGPYGGSPDLFNVGFPAGVNPGSWTLGAVKVADILPTWTRFFAGSVNYRAPYTAAGASTSTGGGTSDTFYTVLGSNQAAGFVGPVTSLTMNGNPGMTALTVPVGGQLDVAWAAPASGRAHTYTVTMRELANANGASQLLGWYQMTTDQTSLTITPNNFPTSGKQYVVCVNASSASATAPWERQLPYYTSKACGGIVTVP